MLFINRCVSGILLGLLLFVASGCMLAGNKSVCTSGKPIDNNALAQVKNGETTKSELIALLGAPSSTSVIPDKTEETLKYRYTKTTSDQSVLIFIWAVNNSTVETESVAFKLKDGIVVSYQKDK